MKSKKFSQTRPQKRKLSKAISAILVLIFIISIFPMTDLPVLADASGNWTDYAVTTAPDFDGSIYTIEKCGRTCMGSSSGEQRQ